MTNREFNLHCGGCGVTRRRFLSGCARCAVAAGLLGGGVGRAWGAEAAPGRGRIRVLYALHATRQPGPDWPNQGFDFAPIMEQVNTGLAQACPEWEFCPAEAAGPDQAKAVLKQDETVPVDGYVVLQMNAWNQVVQTVAATGKPVLYVDFKYGGSGGFLVYTAAFLRQNARNVGFVSSSRMEDLVAAVRCFSLMKEGVSPNRFGEAVAVARRARTPNASALGACPDECPTLAPETCLQRFAESRILAVRGTESGPAESILGIPVTNVAFAELNAAWKEADPDETKAVVQRWRLGAREICDVSAETLAQSAAMYLAERALLRKYRANAITINCLGGFYGGHIHAYPCLGFHQLLNEGLVGGCEGDVRSAATMLALTTLTHGRPGYISDPVIDTSRRQIIYAHCVASNKPFGPMGKPNPFSILTHSEDRQGASVRSFLPTGWLTTTVQFDQARKELLLHQARTVANDPDDRACRTKLCAEPVGDLEKLFTQWDQWGWHRVTCYGDLKKPLTALADLLGYKVVLEA